MTCTVCAAPIAPALVARVEAEHPRYLSDEETGHSYSNERYFCSLACKAVWMRDGVPHPTFLVNKDSMPTRYRQHRDRHLWQRSAQWRKEGRFDRT